MCLLKKLVFVICLPALLLSCNKRYVVDIHETAVTVAEKGLSQTDLGNYMGTCLYHGMADLALASSDPKDKERVMDILGRIASGEVVVHYDAFMDYLIGGQAVAMLAYKGEESLVPIVKECARKMWTEQPRTSDNIMTRAKYQGYDCFWLDVAFTVTPFFLYAGLLEDNNEYVDYAAYMALHMSEILYDSESGLYHQARNHPHCPGISQDCWSRGNGWLSMAFGSLLKDYPHDGRYWNDIVRTSTAFYENVCRYQDADGMFHQELTDFDSYVETSGSAQIVAGLGAAIQAGVLDRGKYMPYFLKGINGILGYVDADGSVGHCCRGNLVPGKGTKDDYKVIHWSYNENHSFGPVVLALAQALELGVKKVELNKPMGSSNNPDRPRAYARVINEFKDNVAWENDRVAFRLYSQISSNQKPLSGIDFWAKTVDYPIVDEWYGKLGRNESYHVDTGTGGDWYDMGSGRGIGGTGTYFNGQLYCALPYSSVRMDNSGPQKIDFTVFYDPYEVGGDSVTETKRIEMVCGTSFYKVSETVSSASGNPVTLAIGVQNFGNASKICADGGKIFIIEELVFKDRVGLGCDKGEPRYRGEFGSAVIVDPKVAGDVVTDEDNVLQLVTVNSGDTLVYYIGATWQFQQNSGRWNGDRAFWQMTSEQTSWNDLNEIYN